MQAEKQQMIVEKTKSNYPENTSFWTSIKPEIIMYIYIFPCHFLAGFWLSRQNKRLTGDADSFQSL